MQEFEFRYDLPYDPDYDVDGRIIGVETARCLIEPVLGPWEHPLYRESTLPADVGRYSRPTVGINVFSLEVTQLGLLLRVDPAPAGRLTPYYRCHRRFTQTRFEHGETRLIAARPWIMITMNRVVMRGAKTRGEAIRNAFISFPNARPVHDPGPPPDAEDAEAMEGLDYIP